MSEQFKARMRSLVMAVGAYAPPGFTMFGHDDVLGCGDLTKYRCGVAVEFRYGDLVHNGNSTVYCASR